MIMGNGNRPDRPSHGGSAMGSVVELSAYRRARAAQAAAVRPAPQPAPPDALRKAEIVILPVVSIVRDGLPPAGAA